MRALFLGKYGPMAASSRYRLMQYFPALRAAGVECEFHELLGDRYLKRRFETGGVSLVEVARGYASRVRAIAGAGAYDVVVIQLDGSPQLPALMEWSLALRGIPYVMDVDDAIFHMYDEHPNWLFRRLMGNKMRHVFQSAAWTFAGNEYIQDYVRMDSQRVELMPTVIDLERYPAAPPARSASAQMTIGWIGSPSTATYLKDVAAPLAEFCRRHDARLITVGSGPLDLPGVPLEVRPWSEATEVSDMCEFDVGIMPLPDTPWARGKCGFKLIQYMAAHLPVVASPVGVNTTIVSDGVSGMLAKDGQGWFTALDALAKDALLRARMGAEGRSRVEHTYCLQVTAPRWVSRLLSLVEGGQVSSA